MPATLGDSPSAFQAACIGNPHQYSFQRCRFPAGKEDAGMTYETLTATPSSPHIGAEIGNIDLTKPLTNKQVAELHDAFTRFQVVFFRDQKIDFDDQIRLASHFGPLGRHVG